MSNNKLLGLAGIIICISYVFATKFAFVINLSSSLPYKYFLLVNNRLPKKENYIAFYAKNNIKISGLFLTKQVYGVPGDSVKFAGRKVYVNEKLLGKAKEISLNNEKLILGPSGTIPNGKYFVWSNHADSLDSRYQRIGWVDEKDIIGVAYPLPFKHAS